MLLILEILHPFSVKAPSEETHLGTTGPSREDLSDSKQNSIETQNPTTKENAKSEEELAPDNLSSPSTDQRKDASTKAITISKIDQSSVPSTTIQTTASSWSANEQTVSVSFPYLIEASKIFIQQNDANKIESSTQKPTSGSQDSTTVSSTKLSSAKDLSTISSLTSNTATFTSESSTTPTSTTTTTFKPRVCPIENLKQLKNPKFPRYVLHPHAIHTKEQVTLVLISILLAFFLMRYISDDIHWNS
jgi:hypothetical protein